MTEYSGFKYALFFMGEYLGLFAIAGLGVTLFLGGWQAPFPGLGFVPTYVWFFGKLAVIIMSYLWIRGTFPRVRIDQLMRFAWLCLIPMALHPTLRLDAGRVQLDISHAGPGLTYPVPAEPSSCRKRPLEVSSRVSSSVPVPSPPPTSTSSAASRPVVHAGG